MLRRFIIATTVMCVSVATLAGCSETYPRLPDLTRMNNILSPKEQDDTIKTLTSSQQSTDATAATDAKQAEGQQQ